MTTMFRREHLAGWLGLALLSTGSVLGLFVAPPERHMGEVQRIMYIHVPTAWNTLLCFTFAFGVAIASLWTGARKHDHRLVAAIEVGVVLNALLLVQGMLWGKPTWGVYWDWDVRLTTSLVLLLLFLGVLALRSFVQDVDRRAAWTAIATIVAYVDVPLVYFCVRWWRSLHQVQSTPETVDAAMVLPLRINAFALLFLMMWMIGQRARIEAEAQRRDEAPEPPRAALEEEPLHA